MSRVFQIAKREYVSTAVTKGFIIGAILLPALFAAAIPLIIYLMRQADAPKVVGRFAIIDRTDGGVVAADLQSMLNEAFADQKEELKEAIETATQDIPLVGNQAGIADAVIEDAFPEVDIRVEALPADIDEDEAKQPLLLPAEKEDATQLLAVAVVDANAILMADGDDAFGGFQIFVRPKLDERNISAMRRAVRDLIRKHRYDQYGQDQAWHDELRTVAMRQTKEVTAEGDKASRENLRQFLPVVFMMLMVMSVMIGGQYLLTTTVEEKSSRVVELLLSATSPMQLMTGKILGQMGVGLTMLFMYTGVGIGALVMFSLTDALDFINLVYMLVFFAAAYFMIASLLAAIGAAVNDMREAQAMQTPVIMAIMVPYILWLPISQDPNSTFATVLSFVPPISPFIMMIRVVSTDPPSLLQILLSIAVMAIGAYACVWFAAKVFRVGLLMYGKPPNLRTLIRWVRMA